MANKKGKVLCVDDEPNILRSLQWLLQKEFEVLTASSGQDGLALVKQHSFDVVISDQRMPGMMGSEFLREVRILSPRSMRLLLTGYSDLPAILRSVNEGEVFRFINKPWKINELPKMVAEAALIAQSQNPPATDPAVAGAPIAEDDMDAILVVDDDPLIVERLLEGIGQRARITHARNIAEAVAAFDTQDIGIILSDTRVGNVDTTRMLKVLKQEHPDIVTVVYTADSDADDVITLINQGQIFRFIPKPVKPITLMLAVSAAIVKRRQLKENPDYTRRHVVERVAQETRDSLEKDIEQVAKTSVPPSGVGGAGGFLSRVAGGFRRMFGGK